MCSRRAADALVPISIQKPVLKFMLKIEADGSIDIIVINRERERFSCGWFGSEFNFFSIKAAAISTTNKVGGGSRTLA